MRGRQRLTEVSVVAAGESDRATIERLIQLYLYDMAAELPFPIRGDGQYDYDLLDRFWQHPYLFQIAGELVGFALVIDECPITARRPCWFMAEFFVLRPWRHRGVGRSALNALLNRHPGPWHIASQSQNPEAGYFWARSVPVQREEFVRRFDGADWTVRAFMSE